MDLITRHTITGFGIQGYLNDNDSPEFLKQFQLAYIDNSDEYYDADFTYILDSDGNNKV